MPSAFPTVSRRRVLAGGGLLALAAVAAAACGSDTAPKVDELESQRELASRDSALAAAAAAVAPRTVGRALTQVASERAEHARALAAEITRLTGKTEPTPAGPGETTSGPPAPTPTVAEVVSALRKAAESAGQLAIASSGYRAGLLASIAAACTAARVVTLGVTP
ncbi:MAG TPA: hypothetical protein VF299_04790 [Mycobacterium sp.]